MRFATEGTENTEKKGGITLIIAVNYESDDFRPSFRPLCSLGGNLFVSSSPPLTRRHFRRRLRRGLGDGLVSQHAAEDFA
jgi:hypothetical protein